MSDQPDYYQVPNVPLHEGRGNQPATRPFTSQQLQEIGAQLLEQFLKKVVEAVVGFFVPGGGTGSAFDQLQSWAEDVLGPAFLTGDWDDLLNSLFGTNNILSTIIASVVPGLDASKIITGIFGTGTIPGLDVSKIISGIFGAGFIPGLDTSKIITGQFGQSMITNLITDLGNRLLSSIFHTKVNDGTNLILGSDFEDSSLWAGALGAGMSVSTTRKHSGTQSLKYITQSFWGGPVFTHNENGVTSLTVKPGEKYYQEVWVYPEATNGSAAGNGQLRFYATFSDSTGGPEGGWQGPAPLTNTLTAGAWNKLSAVVTVPAGYDRMYLTVSHVYGSGTPAYDIPSGDVFYYDDVILREVTESQSIITQLFGGSSVLSQILAAAVPGLDTSKIITGLFPQSQVTGLTTIASNLASAITNLFGGSSVLSQIIAAAVPGLDTSKIITGNFSQSMITNLVSDLTARLLKTVFQASTKAGSNLFISPTFDDTSIVRVPYGSPASAGYSTAQKFSGTHSWTWTANGTWAGLFLAPNETNEYVVASPGDKFYVEARLFAPTANNHTGSQLVFLAATFKDSSGVNADQFSQLNIPLNTFTKNAWQQFSFHTSAVPAGFDRVAFNIQTQDTVPSGNVYYIDNVIVREETQEQSILGGLFGGTSVLSTILDSVIPGLNTSKITSGNFSQSMITNLVGDLGARLLTTMFTSRTTAGSNLVLNPDFENTTLTMGGSTGSYSTEQKRTGSYSWKFVNTAAWEAVEFHNQDTNLYVYNYPEVGVKIQPGQKFYGEVWVRPHASNTKPNPFLNLQITISDSTGVNSPTIVLLQQTTTPLTAGTWTKMSGYGTIPAGYDRGNLSWQVTDVSAVGDTYYLDNALFREETAATDIKSQIFGSTSILSTILASVIPGLNTSKITGGTFVDSMVPGIGTIIDNVVTKLFGLTGSGFSQSDSAAALQNTASQIAANAASIQALTTTTTGQQNSGRSVTINFADYANGSLPAAFTVNYSGAGTSTEGIIDGRVQWTSGNASNRTANNIYNVLETFTDYQVAGMSWAYGPENFSGSRQARGRLILRSNSAGTTYVYMDVFTSYFDWYFEIGCVVSGTKTVLKSATQFASGYGGVSQMYFAAGTAGGVRIFQVYSGTTLVYAHTEVGTTSQFGAGFRNVGFGGDYIGVGGASHPPTVNGFAFADNLPPTYPGSGARIYRGSTTQVGVTNGVNLLPTNFFGTTAIASNDITVDLVNGNLAVYHAGRYNIKFSCTNATTSNFPDRLEFILFINGSANLYSGHEWMRGINGIGGFLTPKHFGAVWTGVELASGDYISIGYNSSSTQATVMQGEGTGLQTYLSISLANKSLA